jgi:hypothetical protein
MSSLYVRDTIRTWASEAFTVPFIDTINLGERPANGAAVWASVEFETETETKISFCDDMEAAGLAGFIFCGLPGQGDSDVLAEAEASIAALLARQDTADLVLLYAHAPIEASSGTADHFYRVNIGVEYRHYYGNGGT